MTRKLPYTRQQVDDDDVRAVIDVLNSDWLTTGPMVQQFEQRFAQFVEARFAVAVSSGTAALHAACFALGLEAGDEVLVPANTFLSTANAVCFLSATPRFVDIDPKTLCMDPAHAQRLVGPRTKGIIPVHFGGVPADMAALGALADKHDLWVLEDAAHALGASLDSRPVGCCARSQAAAFSFHPTKQMTAGEGGMVTTNDEALANAVGAFRTHGCQRVPAKMKENPGPWWYEMHWLGANYRLSDIHAALGWSQLTKLQAFVEKRRQLAGLYRQLLSDSRLPITLQAENPAGVSSAHLMLVRIDFDKLAVDRVALIEALKQWNIFLAVHYIPVNQHPWYRENFPDQTTTTPETDLYYSQTVSLPLFTQMDEEDVRLVVDKLTEVLSP